MIIGVGTDLVEVSRIRRLAEKFGTSFLARIYTPIEQEYCAARPDPWPSYSARFAAKEAVMKVLRTGRSQGVRWRDIEMKRRKGEAPFLVLYGKALQKGKSLGIQRWHLSVTHTRELASVVVVGETEA